MLGGASLFVSRFCMTCNGNLEALTFRPDELGAGASSPMAQT